MSQILGYGMWLWGSMAIVLFCTIIYSIVACMRRQNVCNTVEHPPNKDPLKIGHNANNLSTEDTIRGLHFRIVLIDLRRETNLSTRPKGLSQGCMVVVWRFHYIASYISTRGEDRQYNSTCICLYSGTSE